MLNRAYVKRQAVEAVSLFFAPAAGVYNAVTGQRMRVGRVEAKPQKKSA